MLVLGYWLRLGLGLLVGVSVKNNFSVRVRAMLMVGLRLVLGLD
jgi:hypothetical protein